MELKIGENLSKEREATKWKALELETAIKTSKFVSHGQDYAKCQLLEDFGSARADHNSTRAVQSCKLP